jgi:hypothetical protein
MLWPNTCEIHSHNDKSILAIPNMPGIHWTKVVWALAMLPYNLGSGHATFSVT